MSWYISNGQFIQVFSVSRNRILEKKEKKKEGRLSNKGIFDKSSIVQFLEKTLILVKKATCYFVDANLIHLLRSCHLNCHAMFL